MCTVLGVCFFIYLLFTSFLIGCRKLQDNTYTLCCIWRGCAWWKVNSRANKRRVIHHVALQSVINHRRRLWSLGNAVWVASLDDLRLTTQTACAAFVLSGSSRPLRSASMVTPIFTSHLYLSRQTGALFYFLFCHFCESFCRIGERSTHGDSRRCYVKSKGAGFSVTLHHEWWKLRVVSWSKRDIIGPFYY